MKRIAIAAVNRFEEDGETMIRSKIQDYPATPFGFGAVPGHPETGLNLHGWTLAVLPPESAETCRNDPDIVQLPAVPYSREIHDLGPAAAQKIWDALERWGIDIDRATLLATHTFGDVVDRIGRILWSDFDRRDFPLD
jgi:hypothetical protein